MIKIISLLLLLAQTTYAAELHFEQDRSLPLVYINIAFKGGATQDPDGKNGATDLMARLMLRGTKGKTKQQIDLALDQLGANLGVETRAEFIAFRASVLSENLKPFLALMEEIISTPSFQPRELEKLKKEQASGLLDELSQDRNLARLRFDQVFFKGHPYAKSNTGRIKDIQSLNVGDIQKQYQLLINQSQMIVLASGDTTQNEFVPFVTQIEKARNGKNETVAVPAFNSEPKKLRVVIFDKPDRTQTQVIIGQKGITFNNPQLDALQIANYAFGGGSFQSRLMVELRVKRGWTYGAGSGFKLGSHAHSWKLSFFPKNSDTPPAIAESLKMVRALKEGGLTVAEFNAAKESLINSAGFTFNTPAKRMENQLSEIIFGLPNDYYKNFASRIEKLSLSEVNQALKSFLTADQMMVGVVATASISKPEIAKALGLAEKEIEVQDYQKE